MLYKVTPMMEPEPEKKAREPGQPRKRRATAIYDRDGNEVLISLMCLKCRTVKPLAQFGLRRMADGAIRNQPWCRTCRSGAGTHKSKKGAEVILPETAEVPIENDVPVAEMLPVEPEPLVAAESAEAAAAALAEEAMAHDPFVEPPVDSPPSSEGAGEGDGTLAPFSSDR
jgi:hypothetical protein